MIRDKNNTKTINQVRPFQTRFTGNILKPGSPSFPPFKEKEGGTQPPRVSKKTEQQRTAQGRGGEKKRQKKAQKTISKAFYSSGNCYKSNKILEKSQSKTCI